MKKLFVLTCAGLTAGLAGIIALAVLWVNSTSRQADAVASVHVFTDVRFEANEIRTQMIAMSNAMRGYLLNPSNKDEAEAKQAADDALAAAVKRLVARTTSDKHRQLVQDIAKLDEEQLNRLEDKVLELAAQIGRAHV